MLVTRVARRVGGAGAGRRQLWTGQESLEQDDPEMFSLVQQEKRRQVQYRVISIDCLLLCTYRVIIRCPGWS